MEQGMSYKESGKNTYHQQLSCEGQPKMAEYLIKTYEAQTEYLRINEHPKNQRAEQRGMTCQNEAQMNITTTGLLKSKPKHRRKPENQSENHQIWMSEGTALNWSHTYQLWKIGSKWSKPLGQQILP